MPIRNRAIEKVANKSNVFVDRSAWIALFSRRDQHHVEADRIFRAMVDSKQQMITSNLVLAEIHRLFLHRAGTNAAVAALKKIEASRLVGIVFADFTHHQSAMIWLAKLLEYSITYADAVSFAIMEAAGCREALSYDRHFQIAGFKTL